VARLWCPWTASLIPVHVVLVVRLRLQVLVVDARRPCVRVVTIAVVVDDRQVRAVAIRRDVVVAHPGRSYIFADAVRVLGVARRRTGSGNVGDRAQWRRRRRPPGLATVTNVGRRRRRRLTSSSATRPAQIHTAIAHIRLSPRLTDT